MSRKQNLKNLRTEKDGIIILRSLVEGFMVPDTDQRRYLYKIVDIDYRKYSRSIDGIILHVSSFEKVSSSKDFTFVEIKTTNSSSVKEFNIKYLFEVRNKLNLSPFNPKIPNSIHNWLVIKLISFFHFLNY